VADQDRSRNWRSNKTPEAANDSRSRATPKVEKDSGDPESENPEGEPSIPESVILDIRFRRREVSRPPQAVGTIPSDQRASANARPGLERPTRDRSNWPQLVDPAARVKFGR
jgi:hypothetical protein